MTKVNSEQVSERMARGKISANTTKSMKRRPFRDKVCKKTYKETRMMMEGQLRESLQMPHESSLRKNRKEKKREIKRAGDGVCLPEKLPSMKNPIQEGLKKLAAGRFRFLNEQLYTSTGAEAYNYFHRNPDAFYSYHDGFAQQMQKWPNHPLETIIKWLRHKPSGSVVLDMGCGDAKIAATVGEIHKVHSYDLLPMNSLVVACDMAHLPVEASFADIVVFCLSLMGTNLTDYIKEARRVLKYGGILKIAEVTSRFMDVRFFCKALCKMGFEQTEEKLITNYFTMLEFRKIEKVENKRPFGLKLKPCLYKRR